MDETAKVSETPADTGIHIIVEIISVNFCKFLSVMHAGFTG